MLFIGESIIIKFLKEGIIKYKKWISQSQMQAKSVGVNLKNRKCPSKSTMQNYITICSWMRKTAGKCNGKLVKEICRRNYKKLKAMSITIQKDYYLRTSNVPLRSRELKLFRNLCRKGNKLRQKYFCQLFQLSTNNCQSKDRTNNTKAFMARSKWLWETKMNET